MPTVFLLRHYQSTNHQKIVPPKEYCRHRCNFRFYYSNDPYPVHRAEFYSLRAQIFRIGVSWVTDVHLGSRFFITFFWTHLHLFNVETGTINSAINSHLYAFDRELNSTPFHSARTFKLGFVCATIELLISYVYKHFCSIESVKSNSIVSTCDYYIDSTCEF